MVMPAFPALSMGSRYSDQVPYGLVQKNGPGERDGCGRGPGRRSGRKHSGDFLVTASIRLRDHP
ncbi:hypothetical protein SGPA1_10967 [Streptomyces misionensis JCM 4497]